MFKKDATPGPKSKLKSSVQRSLRQSLLTSYPLLTPYIEEVLPKKASLEQAKLGERGAIVYFLEGQPICFQYDSRAPLLPHLKVVHRFPSAFPTITIDRGAIRFVLSGATLMAPGLTSKGGRLPIPKEIPGEPIAEGVPNEGPDEEGHWSRELKKGEPVVVLAEGKQEACLVGVLNMGTDEIKAKGKGPAIEDGHYLGDGLWALA